MTPRSQSEPGSPTPGDAASVASRILDLADRDISFVACVSGESKYILVRHFQTFVEMQLRGRDVAYGDHPFLRPFVEMHARELADFVTKGIGLRHQLGLRSFETLEGDPMRLFRVDLWDTLRTYIEEAEQHFVSDLGGLQKVLREIGNGPPAREGGA